MIKLLKKIKKFFLINTAVTLSIILMLSLYCRYVQKTSINAFIASVYLKVTDFNGIYESTEKCYNALKDMKESNRLDIEVPEMKCETKNRHIGKNGFVVICDESLDIVTEDSKNYGKNISSLGLDIDFKNTKPGEIFEIA